MDIGTEDPPPSIEEHLLVACNTSSLRVDTLHDGADIHVAVGMAAQNGNQLGLALMHLRSEWDRCDKPRKKTAAEIATRAQELAKGKARHPNKQARVEALVWHATAMRQRASVLNGRSVVLGLLHDWAALHAVDADLLSPSLYHWLAPACGACDGHGKYRITDTPSLSDKDCDHCHGTGMWPRPLGAERIHNHIKSCIARVRGGTKAKLYG